jgi:hypothetical protein
MRNEESAIFSDRTDDDLLSYLDYLKGQISWYNRMAAANDFYMPEDEAKDFSDVLFNRQHVEKELDRRGVAYEDES